MDRDNLYESILTATRGQRAKIYETVYDEVYRKKEVEAKLLRPPGRRRQNRISIYRAIIGQGHGRILEIGCGLGDLTYALADRAREVVGVDISAKVIDFAKKRRGLWPIGADQAEKVEFLQMRATQLDFPPGTFDYVASTSMIEHLHPDDVGPHLEEVWRVLKTGGGYLVWCPNRLGHHGDRDGHLSMFSYQELIDRMKIVGFRDFRSPLFNRPPMVGAEFKVFLEKMLSCLGIRVLWSHLGLRNILLVAKK